MSLSYQSSAMADQSNLIFRKQEVRRQIEQTRRRLEHERTKESRWHRGRIRKLEDQLERLMSEEYNLRLSIDRNR